MGRPAASAVRLRIGKGSAPGDMPEMRPAIGGLYMDGQEAFYRPRPGPAAFGRAAVKNI